MWQESYDAVQKADIMLDKLKLEKAIPSEEEFYSSLNAIQSAERRVRLLKKSNNLGTVIHSIVWHGYDNLLKIALDCVLPSDRPSLLMIANDAGTTGME